MIGLFVVFLFLFRIIINKFDTANVRLLLHASQMKKGVLSMKKDQDVTMHIYVESVSPSGIKVVNSIPDGLKSQDVVELKKISYVDGVVDRNRTIAWSDIMITHVNIDAQREVEFMVSSDSCYVEMVFYTSCSSGYELDGPQRLIHIDENQHNLLFLSQAAYANYWPIGQNKELISIILTRDLFYRYVPQESMFARFLKAIDKEEPTPLFKQSAPITPQMEGLLRDILATQHDTLLRRMSMEAKVIELLMMQFQQYLDLHYTGAKQTIDSKIHRTMLDAKYYMDYNFAKPSSLLDLAQKVGTSEYYLKKYFKQVFGKTVFDYMNEKRMVRARYLLQEEGMNVNEVAQYLGIPDATNFSAAFKKYFGVSPSKLYK